MGKKYSIEILVLVMLGVVMVSLAYIIAAPLLVIGGILALVRKV